MSPRRSWGSDDDFFRLYQRELCGKLHTYYKHCVKNAGYLRSFSWMLLGHVGDGLMVGASGRILAALRVPMMVRNSWMVLLLGTTERTANQTADLVLANDRDNNRVDRNTNEGDEFHTGQLETFRRTRWMDFAVCGSWVAIAVGTAFLGGALWPMATVGIVVVTLAMTWNRSRRNVLWENLRIAPAQNPPKTHADMVPRYGSTIGNTERLVCTVAYSVGVALGLALETWIAPACMAASLGVVVGSLVGGCAVGTVARWRQACAIAARAAAEKAANAANATTMATAATAAA